MSSLSEEEWESLCDSCGKCCQLEQSGFACPSLDCTTNRCTDYENRLDREMCLKVTPSNTLMLHRRGILPSSCAYVRHVQRKAPLPRPVEPARLVPFCVSGYNFQRKYNKARKLWYKLKVVDDPKSSPQSQI